MRGSEERRAPGDQRGQSIPLFSNVEVKEIPDRQSAEVGWKRG